MLNSHQLKVKITGLVRIKKDGNILYEIKNNIKLQTLVGFIARAFQNNLPTCSGQNQIILSYTIFVPVTVVTQGNTISWYGQFSVNQQFVISYMALYVNFQSCNFLASDVTTDITLQPGTYEIEWIWQIDDPVGVILYILQLAFTQTLSSVSYSLTPPSSSLSQVSQIIDIFPYGFTITYIYVCSSGSVEYTSVTLTVTVKNTSNTSQSFTITFNTAYEVQFTCPNTIIIPVSILFSS